jgi:hypothetical protein
LIAIDRGWFVQARDDRRGQGIRSPFAQPDIGDRKAHAGPAGRVQEDVSKAGAVESLHGLS